MSSGTEPGDRRIPVALLTGFLGSGKTTVLRHVLTHAGSARIAVVINEFGEIGIDHTLVAGASDRVVELPNGCLCCAVRSDLVHTLFGLYAAQIEGRIAPFDRVVIETSGLADPGPVLRLLFTDRALAPRFRLDGVLATIDAVHGAATLARHPEALRQAAAAHRLLLTKTDIAPPGASRDLAALLARINPDAVLLTAVQGAVPPSAFFGAAAAVPLPLVPDGAEGHGAHSLGVTSFAVALDRPVAWADLGRWIDRVRALDLPGLLRIKGLLDIRERPGTPLVLQAAQATFHPPVFLDRWPGGTPRARLVFILQDTPAEPIRASLGLLGAAPTDRSAAAEEGGPTDAEADAAPEARAGASATPAHP